MTSESILLLALLYATGSPWARSEVVGPGSSVPDCASIERSVQDDQESQIAKWMKVVRDPNVRRSKRGRAGRALLESGPVAAEILARYVIREIPKAHKSTIKSQAKLVASVEVVGTRLVAARMDKPTLAEVEVKRDLIRAVARDGNLSKERIVQESDPALEWLRETLTADVREIFDEEPELIGSHGELRALIQREIQDREFLAEALEILADADMEQVETRFAVDPGSGDPLDDLAIALERAAERSTPISKASRSVLESNVAIADLVGPLEAEGIEYLNSIRLLVGLNALAIDVMLCDAARDHSKDMHEKGFFAHVSPVEGKRSFGQRAANFGTSASAENIAAGRHNGRSVIMGWWHSPGHHKNMLRGAGRTALGRFENMWTQMFG
jgi:hypothetical protein